MLNRITARPAVLLTRAGFLSRHRGLSMLEYALMALVVIAVFGVLFTFVPDFFRSITGTFRDLIGNESGGDVTIPGGS